MASARQRLSIRHQNALAGLVVLHYRRQIVGSVVNASG